MHQTFYIDIDEEISSVIDRLSKSMSVDNYYVVPKRALFLQSIVNLKILKREADKVGKNVIIVTQDEIGCSMAERSGIEVRPNLDGLESALPEAIAVENKQTDEQAYEEEDIVEDAETARYEYVKQDKQLRLNNVGSGDYYQQNDRAADSLKASLAAARPLAKGVTNIPKKRPGKIVLEKTPKVQLRKELP